MAKPLLACILCLTLLGGGVAWSEEAVEGHAISLTLVAPGGDSFADVPVAVYLDPFSVRTPYTPKLLYQSATDTSGLISFSLSDDDLPADAAKSATGEINAILIAISSGRSWRIHRDLVLPVGEGTDYRQTIEADIGIDPRSVEGASAQSLVAAQPIVRDCATCDATGDEMGMTGSWTQSNGAASAANDESLESGSGDGVRDTWVRVMNQHLARGMSGSFHYLKGEGTKHQIVQKFCSDSACGAWEIGGAKIEQRGRKSGTSFDKRGPFHRIWSAHYEERRYRTCVHWVVQPENTYCEEWKRYWAPHHWRAPGMKGDGKDLPQPKRRRENSEVLRKDQAFWTAQKDNVTYRLGVRFMGFALASEADYSSITRLQFVYRKGCRKRWLYGKHVDPIRAKVIHAKSRGC